jgi:DNA-binding SARP family transcriptional activator/tetratricopeptide (TPR) repeat protein
MTLRLSLVGSPHVIKESDGRLIPLAPRDAVMVTWLILVGPTTRAQMAAMLWPDRSEDLARNSLRQRLFQLRRQIGAELVTGAITLELVGDVVHDIARDIADEATPGADADPSLLGEITLPECPALHAWLQSMRERRARQHRAALIDKLDRLESQGDWHGALPLAQTLVDLEPLSEHAHRRVMRLHYLLGDRPAALVAFDRLERRLKDDVGTRPDAASLNLLRTIEQSRPLEGAAARPSRPVPASLMRPPQLVGRETELARMRDILDQGRTVALVGEAGMGKSRLLQALVHDRTDVMAWSGRAGDAASPYATLARGLGQLLRTLPIDLSTRLPHDVRADLARVMPELADAHAVSPSGGMPLRAVKHVMRSAWPRGATFVLDDLHFADDASIELLQQCIDDEDRPLWRVVFAMRPTPRSPQTQRWVQQLVEAGQLVPVMLQPLGADDLARLVDSLELPGVDGRDLATALHHRTGGNPLFALETLKAAWAESSVIDALHLPRPGSVAQLIEQQLALLSEPALALARVAALASVDFSLALAEAVLERHAVDLSDAWRELESHQVMRGEGFAHDLVAQAVRDGVPEAIGRALHARIAAWLESRGGEPARVALHHEASGRSDLALPGLRAAAERARVALREPERIEFLLHAADIAAAQGNRKLEYDCVREAVAAHISYVRDDSRLGLLDRLDALAGCALERATAAHIRAYYHGNLGHWVRSVEEGERAVALAREAGDEAVLVTARQRLGTAYAMVGACDQALEHLLSIRTWMEANAPKGELREYTGNLAVVMDNAGRVDEARRIHEAVIGEVESSDDFPQHVTNLGNLAVNRLNAGDVASAREHLAQARQLAVTHALAGTRGAFITLLRARCARAVGRYAVALDRFEEARRSQPPGSLFGTVVRLNEALCWLEIGVLDRAAQTVHEAFQVEMPPRYLAPALVIKARIARAQGQRGDALIEEAVRVMPLGGWYELQFAVRMEAASLDEPSKALENLVAITDESRSMGLCGISLAASLCACGIAAAVDPARGARLARQALLTAMHAEAEALPRVDRWLQPARAFEAAGLRDEAADVARAGAAWLHAAVYDVPERWRENFLTRAEANRLMLALAARLG